MNQQKILFSLTKLINISLCYIGISTADKNYLQTFKEINMYLIQIIIDYFPAIIFKV